VSARHTEASTFPSISSNGVADPRSISKTRCVLSSATAPSIGLDEARTIIASSIMVASGTIMASTSFFFSAFPTAPVFASRVTRLML